MMEWPGVEYAHPAAILHWSKRVNEHGEVDAETAGKNRRSFASLHGAVRELAAADVGLSPQRILQAATYNAARSVGEEDSWGSIQSGMAADMVLLEANPLSDIRNAERITAVLRRGVLHDRADLDRRLQRIQDSNGR